MSSLVIKIKKTTAIILSISFFLFGSYLGVSADDKATGKNSDGIVEYNDLPNNIKKLLPTEEKEKKIFLYSSDPTKKDSIDPAEIYTIRVEDKHTGQGSLYVHSKPVKYYDKNGTLQFIDTSLKEYSSLEKSKTGYSFFATANDFITDFGKDFTRGVQYNKDFKILPITKTEGIETCINKADGVICYKNAFDNTDVAYTITESGVKEEIIIQKRGETNKYSFIFISDKYIPKLSTDNSQVFIVQKGNPDTIDYYMSDLYAYDSFLPSSPVVEKMYGRHINESLSYEVSRNKDQTYTISIVIPNDYLTSPYIEYPITIDPSVSFVSNNNNSQDTFVSASTPTTQTNSALEYIRFGTSGGKKMFGYHRFTTLPSLPTGANITSAYFKLTFRSGQTTPASSSGIKIKTLMVTAHQWYESTITWNNQPYGSAGGPQTAITYNGGYLDYVNTNITSMVQQWYSGTPNYGVDFTYNNETYADYNSVVSSEGEAARAPVLTISYSIVATGISLSASSATIRVGNTYQLTATITPNNTSNPSLTWSTSNSSVATVSTSGLVLAKKVGSAVIYARTANGMVASCSVQVSANCFQQDNQSLCVFVVLEYGLPVTVSYNIFINARAYIDEQASLASRHVSEVTAFTYFDKNQINFVLAYPDLSIGATKVNQTTVSMQYDDNVLVSPDWVWKSRIGYPNILVGSSASLSSRACCYQSDAINPYLEVPVSLSF